MKIAKRLVETPEMLRLICEHASTSDQVRLSCVSRLLFKISAPIIWENVEGVHNLLLLLPGVKTRVRKSNEAEQVIVSAPLTRTFISLLHYFI